ncbi:MAG: hypothetical protein QOI13_3162 [Paraburkholderia sp.]|nr:hypothetical protein [Paraburkholderia sp.]
MINAQRQMACKNGGTTVTADANGAYTATFPFDGPCEIIATSGSTVLHSFASGPGRFNVSPLTELLLDYLAARLNTTLAGLLTGIATYATYQSALTNNTVITSAEQAVVTVIELNYPGVTLSPSTSTFLTISFAPGQPADTDLDNLQAAGAILPNGLPAPSLISAVIAAGVAAGPINTGGGSGATGGMGTTTP